ncbi:Acyl-coenzyme A oxidase 2 [Tephrocybe rancida]|nr:Acyl-coenzyme A oxidase 2 [Tephrocybe rancida]
MLSGARFLSLYTLSAISTAYASIGPVTDLVIANRRISPDGYERAYHETYTGGVPPVSASTLINGKGRYVNGPQADLAIVNVQKGKRYRFRIIAMSCEPAFTFSIDKHLLNVIEADGENVVPIVVDSLDIHAGQRYSAVLKADQPVANYWIRANPDARALPGFDNNRNLAILRYSGAPNSDPVSNPVSTPNAVNPLKEVNLHPLISPAAPGLARPGGADVNINLVTDVDFATLHFTLNGVPFIPPTAPVLLQILSGVQNAQDLLPKGSVYALPRNKVIEISLPGTGAEKGGPHPFHLHGHSFSVIRSGDSSTYNFRNPVRRDTVSTGLAGSNTTIRFVTDNAGPWFLHCHMDFHLELGLAVVLAEDIAGTPAKIHPPQEWDQLCPLYD